MKGFSTLPCSEQFIEQIIQNYAFITSHDVKLGVKYCRKRKFQFYPDPDQNIIGVFRIQIHVILFYMRRLPPIWAFVSNPV